MNVIDDGEFPPLELIPDDEDFALLQGEEASEDENENDDPNESGGKKEREEDSLGKKSRK